MLTGQNLGRVFNSRCGRTCACHVITLITKTAQLKVENSARTTLRFSPVNLRAPHWKCRKKEINLFDAEKAAVFEHLST
jgi:hypothetical protein